jgi:hypothetical protein
LFTKRIEQYKISDEERSHAQREKTARSKTGAGSVRAQAGDSFQELSPSANDIRIGVAGSCLDTAV